MKKPKRTTFTDSELTAYIWMDRAYGWFNKTYTAADAGDKVIQLAKQIEAERLELTKPEK